MALKPIYIRYPGMTYSVPINPHQRGPLQPVKLNQVQQQTVPARVPRNPNQRGR